MDPADYDLMDSALYEALVEGNQDLDEALWYKMEQQVTPKGNTILHIAALYGHMHLVQKILEKHTSLLCVVNNKSETALHIAAREGHTAVVSELIRCAKARPELESGIGATYMVRMMDGDKDTALHKAVRKGHLEVVKLVVKEDPEFEFGANEAGETPLYLAAELQFHECLVEILNNSQRPDYGGPLGRTALHAAIIHSEPPKDSTKLLLEKEASLCEVGDDWGWTPLHYAVRLNNEKAVEEILQVKSSAAYIPAGGGKEGEWTTAVHIAVSENSVVLFKQILQHCPLCWEMVNSKGQNVLHEAILNNSTDIIKFILNSPKMDHLVDEKDEDGNTPLHLLAASNVCVPELIQHPRLSGGMVFNKQQLTPLDIASRVGSGSVGKRGDLTMKRKSNDKTRMEMTQEMRVPKERSVSSAGKMAKAHIVVVALIVTVTFAAGMTVPGGYNDNQGERQGMPILLRKSAFKAFVVTNAIGFVCSISSLIGYITLVEEISSFGRPKVVHKLVSYSILLLDLSLTALILAFITGMFAVLTVHSSAVAVGVCIGVCICIIGIISFLLFSGYNEHWWIVRKYEEIIQLFNKLG